MERTDAESDTAAQLQRGPATGGIELSRRRLLRRAIGATVVAAALGRRPVLATTLTRASDHTPARRAVSTLDNGADTVVVQWDRAALQAVRDTKPGPPMVA